MTLTIIGGENYEFIKEKRPQNLRPRRINKIQTNAVWLEGEENSGQGSYLQIPQSSLMEYDGETLNIYRIGQREMNEEERRNEELADKERERYCKENPYSDGYYHMKSWYSKCSTPWIGTTLDWIKGKQAQYFGDGKVIWDKSIKGELLLQYKVEM